MKDRKLPAPRNAPPPPSLILVHNSSLLLVAIAIGLLAGGLLGTQPSVNGYLGRHVGHPLQAALISFSTGTAALLALCMVNGNFPPSFTHPLSSLPWWSWTGGFIGVILVTSSLIFVPRVGSLPWFAAVMTGQTVAALFLDHYGMLGNPRSPASPIRILGTTLLVAGVLLIVYAKNHEKADPSNQISPSVSKRNSPEHPIEK